MFRPDYSTATDQRIIKTRSALRAGLLTLLETEPFEKISVREIVAAAGVGYNTFFRHYSDKETMLQDIAEEEIRQLVALSVPVLDAKDTYSACLTLCDYVSDNRKLWRILLTGGAAGALRDEFVRISREVAESRMPGKDWLPIDIAVILTTSGTFELLAWWLSENEHMPAEAVARIHQRVVMSPVIDP